MNKPLLYPPISFAICLFIGIAPFISHGQKSQKTYVAPTPYALVNTNQLQTQAEFNNISETTVAAWLEGEFQIPQGDFELLDQRLSPMGFHFHFQQKLNGIALHHKEVKVNIGLDKRSVLAFYDVSTNVRSSGSSFPSFNQLPVGMPQALLEDSEPIYWVEGDVALPASKLTVKLPYNEHRIWIVDANGNWLDEEWLSAHYCQNHNSPAHFETDTNISVKVFNPDPLTSAGVTYGGNYTDMNDQNQANLDPERVTRSVLADFSNGTYNLTNYAVTIADIESPTDSVATRTDSLFHYSRSDLEFQQVNAFYHITKMKEHLEDLGLTSLMNYSITVDANAFFGQDNSRFEYGNQTLYFGNGGVDDAEDTDVVIHEYQHAMSYDASPNTNSGTERRCLDEANGDYYAASYSKHINFFSYEKVFTWDGHNEFWSGRNADNPSNKYYPNISFGGNIYQHTDLWSAVTMDIWDQLGRDTADFLVGCSLYGYADNMTFADAATLILLCDQQHFQGGHIGDLCTIFSQYGILDPCTIGLEENKDLPYGLRGTLGFSHGGVAYLDWTGSPSAQLEMYNVAGQPIWNSTLKEESTLELSSEGLPPGVYVVRILDTQGQSFSFKLHRR